MTEEALHKIRKKKKRHRLGEDTGNLCHVNWYGPRIIMKM